MTALTCFSLTQKIPLQTLQYTKVLFPRESFPQVVLSWATQSDPLAI